MRRVDVNAAIETLVQDAVNEAIAPYREALERIGALIGVKAGVGFRRTRAPRGTGGLARGDASKFEKGQKVKINIGLGSDTGTITEVDLDTNSVMVKRDKNKQVVKRPARGVTAL